MFGLAFIGLIILSGYWLFKTDSGQSFLTEKTIQNANTKLPFQIAYESVKSDNGRVTIKDLHLDTPDNQRIVSLDSLRTGVLLSSIFKNSITIPELTVYGLRVDKTIDDQFLSSFRDSTASVEIENEGVTKGLLNRYLSQLSWTFSQLNLKLDSIAVNLNEKEFLLEQIYVDFDFLQLSKSDFYAVMDTLNIEAVIDEESHKLNAQGILYRDLRDFAFSNMKVLVDEHFLHFNLEAIDVFSDVQRGLKQARFIDLNLIDDSYISISKLFNKNPKWKDLASANVGLNLKFLPKDGILELTELNVNQKDFSVEGQANLNVPDFRLNNYSWNKLSGDVDLDLTLEPSTISYVSEKININRDYFTSAIKLKLKSSLYANELNQLGSIFIENDTLEISHKLNFSDLNGSIPHSLELSSNQIALGSILSGDKSLILQKPKIRVDFTQIGSEIDSIDVKLDVYELKKFNLKRTNLTINGSLNTPAFFFNTDLKGGVITSYGEVQIENGLQFVSAKTSVNNVSLQSIFNSPILSEKPLNGSIEARFDANSKTPFSLAGSLLSVQQAQQTGNQNLLFDISEDDSLGYFVTLKSSILDLSLKSTNTKEVLSQIKNLEKSDFVSLTKHLSGNDSLITKHFSDLPSFLLVADAEFKQTQEIENYFSEPFPSFLDATIEAEIGFDQQKLSGKLSVISDSLSINELNWKGFSTWLDFSLSNTNTDTSSFRSVSLSMDIEELNAARIPIQGISYSSKLIDNHLFFTQKADEFIQNARFDFGVEGDLTDQGFALKLNDFLFGNDIYGWRSSKVTEIFWDDFKHAYINDLQLVNGAERIEINGNLGNTITDLINYRLVNLDLEKLSDLLQSRMPFAGLVNGSFTTSSNTQTPFFEGKLSVDSLTLRGRTMGDLAINSSLDSLSGVFVANLAIKTDSLLYPNIPNQNIYGTGFFNPKRDGTEKDTLAYLQIEFEDLAMWFLPSVASNVFDSTSGRATGYGSFIATGDDFNYDAYFSVDSVYAKPRFINTDYFLSGPIYFTRSEGVIIDTVIVEDQYGDAKLWGNVDLNDFQEEKFMNLSMRLNNLQFMNNRYDPDVPFYGNVRGSGTVTLKGSSLSPTIATPDPIRISPGSELKLPLLDETEFETDRNYIRFTEDFSRPGLSAQEVISRNKKTEEKVATIFSRQTDDTERKFIDFFNLELLFAAPEETTIELIFDDVTNEILRANGSGDIRVGLSDKELLINGTYTLSSGSYNFVSADFFNRKFTLQNGGTIRWDGDPTNAQINVSAVYTQRADFSSFLGQNSSTDNNTTFRYPIDMVLDITGRLQSIENDYQFRLGQNMEFATNIDIINNVIASVNTEQYKLYQATSFLLTNSFLPVENGATGGGLADANRSVISNIQQNPDALIAPLLSGQINNLLNTNLGTVFQNLEIDLNLSTLDQIDLGLALRLFQDRLTIRRNRSVASAPNVNTIGDIDANYKLSNKWSLLLFHRQDPLFSDVSGVNNQQSTNTQALNGVGLEWQQQFNSWQDLTQSIRKAWRRLFGLKEPEIKEEEQSSQSITQKN